MLYAGWSKVIPTGGFHGGNTFSAIDHYAHYITTLHLPYWLGYVSALTEFLGGIFLILGLLTRFVAFLVAVNMLVAIFTVNIHHGYPASQYSLALLVIAFMLMVFGPGAAALDRKLGLA